MNVTKESKITEEVAIMELRTWVAKYQKKLARKGKLTDEHIIETYPDILDAIMEGYLVFDDKLSPKLTLRFPLETDGEDTSLDTRDVSFKSRIKPSTQVRLMEGVNPQSNPAKFVLKYIGYITGLTQAEIDLLDKEDYDTIQQICSVF